jgi:mitochondrial fission protein ELM1
MAQSLILLVNIHEKRHRLGLTQNIWCITAALLQTKNYKNDILPLLYTASLRTNEIIQVRLSTTVMAASMVTVMTDATVLR